MDERQSQIKSGAGLEESRLNQDFLNFLSKWSSPVLVVLSVAALAWAGLQYLERRELERVDRAFGDLHDATIDGNPSPSSLLALADEYEGVRAVPELAKLITADLYLSAYLRGVSPGAELAPATGLPVNESDALDEQQRLSYLDQADRLIDDVLAATEGTPEKALITINALSRAAAIAESRGEFDNARANYDKIAAIAQDQTLPALALFAQKRLGHLSVLDASIALPSQDDLAPLPGIEREAISAPVSTELPPEIQQQLDAFNAQLEGQSLDEAIGDTSDTPPQDPPATSDEP